MYYCRSLEALVVGGKVLEGGKSGIQVSGVPLDQGCEVGLERSLLLSELQSSQLCLCTLFALADGYLAGV